MSHVIVIGAGINGLACALTLARAGTKVTVLEARSVVGGLAAARTFGDFSVPGVRHDTQEIRPAIIAALGLDLKQETEHTPIYGAGVNGLLVHRDPARMQLPSKDAAAYLAFRQQISTVTPLLTDLLGNQAPPLLPTDLSQALSMGKPLLRLRALGRDAMLDLLRIAPMCAGDYLREQFASEILSATLALPAVLGDFAGPWSAGTTAVLLMQQALTVPGVVGGPAAVVEALQRSLTTYGVTVRTNASVRQLQIKDDACTGVILSSGETITSGAVIACCSPIMAMGLLPRGTLSLANKQAAIHIRARASAAKVHLGLKAWPVWNKRPERFTHVRVGAHLDDLERAFDAVKYRRLADTPALDIVISPAHNGKCVLSIMAFGVPYEADDTQQILDKVLTVLEAEAAGIRGEVEHSEVLTPKAIERDYGLSGGNIHHVERALDQLLFMRPARPFANARTPISGLFFGSSGSHPGPGVTLAPGFLAARALATTM